MTRLTPDGLNGLQDIEAILLFATQYRNELTDTIAVCQAEHRDVTELHALLAKCELCLHYATMAIGPLLEAIA